MKVRIARTACDIILCEASRSADREVCGLLVGEGGIITTAIPAANVSPEPERRFEIDPAALLAAHRNARAGGKLILGHYHSHPTGKAMPSLRDAANALQDGALWVIVGEDGDLGAFFAHAGGAIAGRFDAVELEII